MLDKVKKLVGAGFFDVFSASVLNNVINFFSSFILVRILSKSEYGLFTYVWNTYNVIILVCGLGLDSGYLQLSSEKAGDEDYAKKLYSYCVKWGSIFNLIITVGLICISLFAPVKFENSRALFLLISFLPLIQFIYKMVSVYLRSQKRNKDYARLTNINTILIAAATLVGAYAFREKGLIFGYYVAFIVTLIISVLLSYIPKWDIGVFEKEDVKQVFSISIISACNNGLSQLLYLLDVFVIGIIIADELILASYKVASIIPSAMAFVPQAVIIFIYPYFAEHRFDKKWCINSYKKLMLFFNAGNLVITVAMYIFVPLIIKLFYGEQYLDAIDAFRILTISYFFSASFRTISGNLLVTQRRLKFNLIISIVMGITNIFGNIILVSRLGSIGAAYMTLIITVLSGVITTPYLIYCFNTIKENEETENV